MIFFLSGCISDTETAQTRFERDLDRIKEYLRTNEILSVKEFVDSEAGIYMFWQEVSESAIAPEIGDTTLVNYTGRLLNNRVFDTSLEQVARDNNIFNPQRPYSPLEVRIGASQVIVGFEVGIRQMEEGDKATIIFPSIFGYGDDPRAGDLRNEPLIFEIELVEVKGNE